MEHQRDETHRSYFKLLSHLIEGQKVLEIGCGNGELSIEMAKEGFEVIGIDTNEAGINQAAEKARNEILDSRAKFMVMDATSLEFPDNSFDSVLMTEVLEHFKDSRKILEEAVRVARNGGRIIVSVPDGLRIPFPGHLRVFFRDTLLTELGQYVEEITWHELPFKKWLICSFFVRKKELDITDGPAVDILMPTYNGRETIGRAIKSVVNQTYQNWNLIVVNDGGEDVEDILEEFKDGRIRYIRAEHKGKAHALNVGIKQSSGEFINYLDDDDILYPIHLEVLVKAALEQKVDLVYSDWYQVSIDENGREVGRQFDYRQDVEPWMLICQNYINHKCIFHRRSLLDKAGMYDEELDIVIDWDMIRRLFFISKPYHTWSVTSELFLYYNQGVISNRITGLWMRDPDKARRSVERIASKTKDLPATVQELKESIVRSMLSLGYYHGLELGQALQAKDTHIAELNKTLQAKDSQITELNSALQAKDSQITELNSALQAKDSQITELNSALQAKDSQITSLDIQIDQMQRGIGMQLLTRYRRVVEKLLQPGTRRRYYYGLLMKGIRIILNEGWRSFFRKAKFWLQLRKLTPRRHKPSLPEFKASISRKEARKLRFPASSQKPELSIVIPVYNKWLYTVNCLKSICENTDGDYEVIIVDDASSDETAKVLSEVNNLRLIRNEQNAGFIESCNRGAKGSNGKYVLFLNNDTMVTKNWLPPLLEVIKREDVGAVGSKLVYPDGTLQEAGSIVWNDGSALGYGRGDDPEKPEYNYVMEVDYCSGACLLVKKELFEKVGGFDERFKPGYYEDSDLCLSIRDFGYKVIYQPMSVIAHFEGVTCGTDVYSGVKKYQEINKTKFVGKWNTVLQKYHHYPTPENILLARNRLPGKSILVVDDRIPTPSQGSGYPRAYSMLKFIAELGYEVTFFPLDNTTPWQPYTNQLQQLGIEVFYGNNLNFMKFAEDRADYYDLILVSRPHNMDKTFTIIKRFLPDAVLLYDAEAMFSLRDILKARVKGTELKEEDAERMMKEEINLINKADLVITVSENEKAIILERTQLDNVTVWGHALEVKEPQTPFAERKDILFVGGFLGLDSPNEDAILYFSKEVFPEVEQELSCRLFIVGINPPDSVKKLSSSSINVTGYVEDLREYYESCKVFVVPMRYAAGIPLKLLEAMSYGIPSIVSELAASELDLTDGKEVLVARNTKEFIRKVIKLYQEEELWYHLQQNSLSYIRETCNMETLKTTLSDIIESGLKYQGESLYMSRNPLNK